MKIPVTQTAMTEDEGFYRAAERRIEAFTLGLGVVAALVAAWRWSRWHAAGILAGTALGWINFRWLKQGLDVLARLSEAQAEAAKVRVPRSVYVKFAGRYALIIAVVYVIFARSLMPAESVLAGLFALVAAVVLEILYQLVRGLSLPEAR